MYKGNRSEWSTVTLKRESLKLSSQRSLPPPGQGSYPCLALMRFLFLSMPCWSAEDTHFIHQKTLLTYIRATNADNLGATHASTIFLPYIQYHHVPWLGWAQFPRIHSWHSWLISPEKALVNLRKLKPECEPKTLLSLFSPRSHHLIMALLKFL